MTTWTHSPNEESSTWNQSPETVYDVEGRSYNTVKLGGKLWMAENLKTTQYNDGTAIPTGYNAGEWAALSTPAYDSYSDDESNADIYGYLYNWFAVDTGNLAPDGWHVPTQDEVKVLEGFVDSTYGIGDSEWDDYGAGGAYNGDDVGSRLAGNTGLWYDSGLEGHILFGTSGFNFLPGGSRSYVNGTYSSKRQSGEFWTASEHSPIPANAYSRKIHYFYTTIRNQFRDKQSGFSVRCVKDDIPRWNTIYGGVWNLGSLIAWEDLDKHNWEDWN